MTAYYNEFEPYAAAWLRNLIAAGMIPAGEVDERSIVDVRPTDLAGFVQCHFFAGVAGWSLAARLAGWPDDRPLWTGSCPCQPFSVAGKQKGFADERHLWPVWRDLIAERRPSTIMGEQVAGAAGWLGLVRSDLEALGYAVGAIPVEAASAGADHRRDRFWFVADADSIGGQVDTNAGRRADGSGARQVAGSERACDGALANAGRGRRAGPGEGQDQQPRRTETVGASGGALADADSTGSQGRPVHAERSGELVARSDGMGWIIGADGKARRIPEPGIRLLAHGIPARTPQLRAYGNAIDLRPAREVIAAFMECRP